MNRSQDDLKFQNIEEQFRRDMITASGRIISFVIIITVIIRHLVVPMRPIGFIVAGIVAAILFSFPFFLKKNISIRTCSNILLVALTVIPFMSAYLNGGLVAPGTNLFILLPLIGVLTGGSLGAWLGLSLAVSSLFLLLYLEHFGHIVPSTAAEILWRSYYLPVVYLGITLVALIIGMMYEKYRRRLQQTILDLSMKAHQASKMAAVGSMAAGVAHEINNPLAIISLSAEQVARKIQRPDFDKNAISASLKLIHETTLRTSKIIQALLTFSRDSEQMSLVKVSILTIINDVVNMCKMQFENQGIKLTVHENHKVELECNPNKISQVVLILLNNAFDAVKTLDDKWVKIEINNGKDHVILSVTDSGSGIPEEIVDKLMDPFFTTKEIGSGGGLGLSIAKGIVETHHGKIWYDQTSKNTRFVVELPLQLLDISANNL